MFGFLKRGFCSAAWFWINLISDVCWLKSTPPVAQVSCWEGTGRSCWSEAIHAETCRDSCPPTRSIPEVLFCLSRREGASGRVQVWRTRSTCQRTPRFSGGNDVTLLSFGKLRFPFCSFFLIRLCWVKKYLHVIRLILFQIFLKLKLYQSEITWNKVKPGPPRC